MWGVIPQSILRDITKSWICKRLSKWPKTYNTKDTSIQLITSQDTQDISVTSYGNIHWYNQAYMFKRSTKFKHFLKLTWLKWTDWFSVDWAFKPTASSSIYICFWFFFFLDTLSIDMNQCTIVWCQRVSKITTDGRHAYHFRAGWPVGTAWASLGSGQHWFTITLVISVDWKNSKKARNIVFVPLERFAVVWAQNLDSKRNTCASSQFCQNTKKKQKEKKTLLIVSWSFYLKLKLRLR